MRILVTDKVGYSLSARKFTDEGYLSAPARVARTGIQEYLAIELGLHDRKPNDVVRVYRPPEEVFNADSLASYLHKEVTDNHPPDMVGAKNYRDYSVGQCVSGGTQDGEFVKIDLLVKDSGAIELIQSGKVQLSAGYYADYNKENGTVDGQSYEYVQRNIVINHVALVDNARAGKGAKIFDKTGVKPMTVKVTLDNGRAVDVADEATAALVEDSLKRLQSTIADQTKELAEKDADLEKEKAKSDDMEEKLEEEKKKSSDEAIAAKVADTLKVHDAARKLVKDYDCAGKSLDAIKLEVVKKLHPNRDFDGKKAEYINWQFDADIEEAKKEEDEGEETKKEGKDSLVKFAQDMGTQAKPGDKNQKLSARDSHIASLENGWKGKKGE